MNNLERPYGRVVYVPDANEESWRNWSDYEVGLAVLRCIARIGLELLITFLAIATFWWVGGIALATRGMSDVQFAFWIMVFIFLAGIRVGVKIKVGGKWLIRP